MPVATINYISIAGSAIWAMFVGTIWYSQRFFGKEWTTLTGRNEKAIKKSKAAKAVMKTTYIFTILSNLLMAYVLAHIVYYVKAETISAGILAGFWMWLGFVATTMLINNLFQGKSIKLYLIDAFYQLFVLLGMGAILVWWA